MIQPTAKASSLPDDLKHHWEDAMAEKFPMSKEEACAYIRGHYGDFAYPRIDGSSITVLLTLKRTIPATEVAIDPSWRDLPTEYKQILSPNSYSREVMVSETIYVSDFRKTAIDEQIKKAKE